MKLLQKTSFLVFVMYLLNVLSTTASTPTMDSTLNADKLIKNADRALLFIVKSAQETKEEKLKRSSKESEPFWTAVKKLNSNIDKLTKYNFLKDKTFHKTLAETVTTKEEVITTYEMLEVNDDGVKEGIEKASKSIDLLYQNYSKEALRMKEGGPLSAKEKEKLDQLKSQNQELLKKLDELEGKVSDNQKMLKKIKKIREKSNEVIHCNHNPTGFFFAMSAMNFINGWMWGYHWWWGPWGGWFPGFYFNYVDIYVNVIDDYTYDWGYLDGAIDAYDYDLEVDLEQIDIETMDEYLDDIEIENDLFQQNDFMNDPWDHAGEFDDNSLDDTYSEDDYTPEYLDDYTPEYMDDHTPEFMDDFSPSFNDEMIEDTQPIEYMDFTDDYSDFDYGSFDEW